MENEERDLEAELKEETDRFHNQNQEAFDKKISGEQELEDRAKKKELKKKLNNEIEGNTRGSTSFSDPLRFQKQLTEFNEKFPMPTFQDVSETYADFKIGTMGGSLIADYVPLPTAVTTGLVGTAAATVGKFKKHIFKAID